jgi:hypothetical protein
MKIQGDARVLDAHLMKDNKPTLCVLMYYNLFFFDIPLPHPFISKRGKVTRKVQVNYLNNLNFELYLYLSNL